MKRRTAIAVLALGTWSVARADEALKAALAGAQRTPASAVRDAWRHPYETLSFFGIRPDMTVVEIKPGGGWYTEILAPYLRDRGQLILAGDDPESASAYSRRSAERLRQKLQAQPAVYDRVRLTVFEPPRRLQIAAAGTVDMVLTFRNVHNWAADGDDVVRAAFRSVHDSLKPGGVFGVVDHRLPAGRVQDPKAASGYLHQAYVVRLAESVGFTLAAASEINANPGDGADHEGGVWALPPTYANKDKDRSRYAAIGESDRMTLKFVKR
jgi:predicted methyltransferase